MLRVTKDTIEMPNEGVYADLLVLALSSLRGVEHPKDANIAQILEALKKPEQWEEFSIDLSWDAHE